MGPRLSRPQYLETRSGADSVPGPPRNGMRPANPQTRSQEWPESLRPRFKSHRARISQDKVDRLLEQVAFGSNRDRHCEPQGVERRPSFRTGYGEAIQGTSGALRLMDRRVASLLAMTILSERSAPLAGESCDLILKA